MRVGHRRFRHCLGLDVLMKEAVVRSESVRNMIRERRMLEHLNHPFLCNLRYSFQDVEYLYVLLLRPDDNPLPIRESCSGDQPN